MPPSDTAGLRAAVRIRDEYGGRIGVLMLSQFLEPSYALTLLADGIGVDGLKTGYIKESGYGIVVSAVRNTQRLILVLTGLESEREREAERR